MSKHIIAANSCLSVGATLILLGSIALFVLSIVHNIDIDLSSNTTFPSDKSFCGDTILSEHRPLFVSYKVTNERTTNETLYKVCSVALPGHLAGNQYNGTFCLYPAIPKDGDGNLKTSSLILYCGFTVAVMFERFGISLGFAVVLIFLILWIVLLRESQTRFRWLGKVFGVLYWIATLLSLVAAFYLMVMDAHRIATSSDWCNNYFKTNLCNPMDHVTPYEECNCTYTYYIGMTLLEAILIVIITAQLAFATYRWVADCRSGKSGYKNLDNDKAISDLTKRINKI
ncbi:hypothetical protein ABK040_001775 [Willaertia magna]